MFFECRKLQSVLTKNSSNIVVVVSIWISTYQKFRKFRWSMLLVSRFKNLLTYIVSRCDSTHEMILVDWQVSRFKINGRVMSIVLGSWFKIDGWIRPMLLVSRFKIDWHILSSVDSIRLTRWYSSVDLVPLKSTDQSIQPTDQSIQSTDGNRLIW